MISTTTKKDLKKLTNYINKFYMKNDQKLFCSTYTDLKYNPCIVDVSTFSPEKKESERWLFDIININAFKESYLVSSEVNIIGECDFTKQYFYSDEFTYHPYYFDRVFFIPTTHGITKEDIEKATKYFFNKVLDCFLIFNYELIELAEQIEKEHLND